MHKVIVTTVKDKPGLMDLGLELAEGLGCPFVERKDRSMDRIKRDHPHQISVIVGEKRLVARVGEQEFFFHPSMALLRIMNYLKGDRDRMTEAMGLEPGMQVLDCTLGFGTDALVASYFVGSSGQVTGLEGSPVVSQLVERGLRTFRPNIHGGLDPAKAQALQALPGAMARIRVINVSHQVFLAQAGDKSYDVVYFDPMFRRPQEDSASMEPLRQLACPDPLDVQTVTEACRVARHRVVLKESRYNREFARLGFKPVMGGKYSAVAYGTIEINN